MSLLINFEIPCKYDYHTLYAQTYLERDLQALRAVENLADFRRLMRAACLRIGGLLNQTETGRDVGIAQPQVHRFMAVPWWRVC
jgi:hypothetical protein